MVTVLDILQSTRFSGGLFLDAEFTAPWCVTAQITPEDCTPFAPIPTSIIAYHYVSAGRVLLGIEGKDPVKVEAGEIVILPRNDTHRIASDLDLPPVSADTLINSAQSGGLARIYHGGGGERSHLWCGFLGIDRPNDPLLQFLPAVLKINMRETGSAGWIESSLAFAARELVSDRLPAPDLLARLAELLFMEAVRHCLDPLPGVHQDRHAGMRDPFVARALALMHGHLNKHWSAAQLAREAGLSKSAFTERFTRTMGEPPIRYLTRQRLQAAAQQLRDSQTPLSRIAFAVGYDSEAAFNRAFKREFGMPPAAWRKRKAGDTGC